MCGGEGREGREVEGWMRVTGDMARTRSFSKVMDQPMPVRQFEATLDFAGIPKAFLTLSSHGS